jgi:tRNA A37 N6-isopentenylltransferase MiaA
MKNNYHVLTVGPTGTGKSQNAYDLLSNRMGETY